MDCAALLRKFNEVPDGEVREIVIDDPSSGTAKSVQDPDVMDLEAFIRLPVCWGDSFVSKNPADSEFALPFKDLLESIKNMMSVAQRKHFSASVDITVTNWFRKMFKSMNNLFGKDALLSRDISRSIGGGIPFPSVREFCYECFTTIRNISEGTIEPATGLVPSEPEMLIWYMAPVKAWFALLVNHDVELEV